MLSMIPLIPSPLSGSWRHEIKGIGIPSWSDVFGMYGNCRCNKEQDLIRHASQWWRESQCAVIFLKPSAFIDKRIGKMHCLRSHMHKQCQVVTLSRSITLIRRDSSAETGVLAVSQVSSTAPFDAPAGSQTLADGETATSKCNALIVF